MSKTVSEFLNAPVLKQRELFMDMSKDERKALIDQLEGADREEWLLQLSLLEWEPSRPDGPETPPQLALQTGVNASS
jgi:hypothetical protein